MANKLWRVVESYMVMRTYEVTAETAEDAEDKLQDFISCNTHAEDVEHLPSLDDTDMYNIECEK